MLKFLYLSLTIGICLASSFVYSAPYSVLNYEQYRKTVKNSQVHIQQLLMGLRSRKDQTPDNQIIYLAEALTDIPYWKDAMGEGDWQPTSMIYKPGALHIMQDPVYRTDSVDCQTLVQVILALLYANNLEEFEHNILKISYGAAGLTQDIVHYYNRNHFIEADFNPINQQNGLLIDVTSEPPLANYAKIAESRITKQSWIHQQQKSPENYVRVLHEKDGPLMYQRFKNEYKLLNYPHFSFKEIHLSYLPKNLLAKYLQNDTYQANETLLNKIPTPAILEIVRDTKKWKIHGYNLKDLIGTETSVSHVGVIYRQIFHKGELIYYKINCNFNRYNKRLCSVTPIACKNQYCPKLMLVHATNSHPEGFLWLKDQQGAYHCTESMDTLAKKISFCNRVEKIPLFEYLTDYQYGQFWYMDDPAFLGIHIEKLIFPSSFQSLNSA